MPKEIEIERVVRWDARHAPTKRKGESCTVLGKTNASGYVQVRYEDGTTAIVPRQSLTASGKVPAQRQPSKTC